MLPPYLFILYSFLLSGVHELLILEERTLTVSSLLNDFLGWPYLQHVFKLERRFTSTKTGKIQEQVVYGITSLSRDTIMPTDLLKKIRAY